MSRNTSPGSYLEVLRSLGSTGKPYFLIGGQAVNVWALRYKGKVNALDSLGPFTSKDCDVWVSYPAFKAIEDGEVQLGKLEKAESPASGQLAIIEMENGEILDLLDAVFGLKPGDSKRASERAVEMADIRVIDLLYLFKAKCHNFVDLDQDGRQDSKHLKILQVILPAYFRELSERCDEKQITDRQLFNEIKLLLGFGKDHCVRTSLRHLGCALDSLLPDDSSRITGFLESLPQRKS